MVVLVVLGMVLVGLEMALVGVLEMVLAMGLAMVLAMDLAHSQYNFPCNIHHNIYYNNPYNMHRSNYYNTNFVDCYGIVDNVLCESNINNNNNLDHYYVLMILTTSVRRHVLHYASRPKLNGMPVPFQEISALHD